MFIVMLIESGLLRFFIDNRDFDDWESTALSWVIAAFVISVLITLVMMGYKGLRKSLAGTVGEKTWSRKQTILLMIVGLLPVFCVTFIVWWSTRDYYNFVGAGGFFKGVLLSWILYITFMLIGHLMSSWRREIL
jgi:magnesium-transporting ATPase (P-type)